MMNKPLPVQLDASCAECLIFTEKEGLLSTVAHDLEIEVTDFEISWDAEAITARFSPRSLRVVNAMKNKRKAPGALGDSDKTKIEKHIIDDVLQAKKHRKIEFRSSSVVAEGKGFRIEGELTLHGVTRPIKLKLSRRGERWSTQVSIDQTDYDIKPFSAMLGALKVKPKLRVKLSLAAEDLPLE